MDISALKSAIFSFVEKQGGNVSFVELMREFEAERGEKNLSANHDTMIMWIGLSEKLCKALIEMETEKNLSFIQTEPLTYMIDGGGLDLPIAKSNRNYKNARWVPVVMNVH